MDSFTGQLHLYHCNVTTIAVAIVTVATASAAAASTTASTVIFTVITTSINPLPPLRLSPPL
eukprot:12410179-Ditylum_brightwellii.AAC.1